MTVGMTTKGRRVLARGSLGPWISTIRASGSKIEVTESAGRLEKRKEREEEGATGISSVSRVSSTWAEGRKKESEGSTQGSFREQRSSRSKGFWMLEELGIPSEQVAEVSSKRSWDVDVGELGPSEEFRPWVGSRPSTVSAGKRGRAQDTLFDR